MKVVWCYVADYVYTARFLFDDLKEILPWSQEACTVMQLALLNCDMMWPSDENISANYKNPPLHKREVALDRVLAAYAYWSQHQAKQHKKFLAEPGTLRITKALSWMIGCWGSTITCDVVKWYKVDLMMKEKMNRDVVSLNPLIYKN